MLKRFWKLKKTLRFAMKHSI